MYKSRHPLFQTWHGMISRCETPTTEGFHRYGGRGITVWPPWRRDFWAFVFYMGGEKPSPEHSIDRYPDYDGNYEPGNVRWATPKEQAENKLKKPKVVKPQKQKGGKRPPPLTPDERAFEMVLTKTTRAEIARALGIKKQNLTRWTRVPPHHVPIVAKLTGLAREKILPSIYA